MRNVKSRQHAQCADVMAKEAYRPVRREDAVLPSRAGIRAASRRRRRRRALLLFYIFLFLTVITAAAVVSLTVLFKIENIQVGGTSRYTQAQIISACGIQKGENLFLAKTKQAEQQIQTKLPYIGTVTVQRKFPAEISIQVSAAQVCGAVEYSQKYAILGSHFRVLEVADKLPENCMLIKGITLKKAQAGSAAEFADTSLQTSLQDVENAIQKNKLENITDMDFSSISKILLTYDDRITINLGTTSSLDYKILFAKKLFDDGDIKSTEKGTLNLSTAEDNDTAYFDPDTSS